MTVDVTTRWAGYTTRWAGLLYEAIERAGFSIDGFARRMGVHRSTLWRIDRGLLRPTEDWAARADALLAVGDTDEEAAA